MSSYNPYDVVRDFEEVMSEYTGAPFAVAVDSCTSALELCLRWLRQTMTIKTGRAVSKSTSTVSSVEINYRVPTRTPIVQIPARTFISVPTVTIQAGFDRIKFQHRNWNSWYWLTPLPVIDAALYLRKDLWQYIDPFRDHGIKLRGKPDAWGDFKYVCLSFQARKQLPIGRGGMILHDDPDADEWFRKARFYGRDQCALADDPGPQILGWRKYMTPEEAARGLTLMQHLPDNPPELNIEYPDLSEIPALQPYIV